MIFIFLTIRSGLLTSQSPGPLWRGSSSTSLSPASHWSRFLYGGIIKDNFVNNKQLWQIIKDNFVNKKLLWQIIKDNLTTTNQKKIFYSTWILTQCSWAGANSWLLPVPSQDRGEHFEQSTKSSTRERDDQHDHDKQQWVSAVPTKKTTWMTTIWLAGGQQRQGWTTADWTEHGAGKILLLLQSMI